MKATEGNGGAPIVLHRDPVRVPDIPRGSMFPRGVFRGADRITFELLTGEALLTYHDVAVISDGTHTPAQVFVTPQDVVTWEPRP